MVKTAKSQIEFMEKPYPDKTTKNIMHPIFLRWFFTKFKDFSEPQRYSIYNIHTRQNTLVSSPTGSGKTLSAFAAIINELIGYDEKKILEDKVYCVYISPLKALSRDIEANLREPLMEIEKIAKKKLNIRVSVRTGDTTQREKTQMLKYPPHILITTPESLSILLTSKKFTKNLEDVSWCIVDEIHALAENKRGVHLSLNLEILSYLSNHMTRIGLSATVSPLEEVAKFLVGDRKCKVVNTQFIKRLDLEVISPVKDLIASDYVTIHDKTYEIINELVMEHKTTLIFTNTRAATERVVHYLQEKYPKNYYENIGAHHGSLSKEHRTRIEKNLRDGRIKVIVCSTSLELGIDIGFIDLVICIGSPKSVSRLLQRIGRSGHRLHETTKGRVIVLDRDDMVECSVMLKSSIEKKIDRIHIPRNALDVLAQQLFGFCLIQKWNEEELFKIVKRSYCYSETTYDEYNEVLDYLSGNFPDLEERYIYAKIWRNGGMIGARGKMSRVIFMTNVGTIPDQSGVIVKVGTQTVGTIDETFLEKLKKRDIFVLGGATYEFRFSRGMVAQVSTSIGRPPTVPQWYSEMLPLSFDLANDIQKFRYLVNDKLATGKNKNHIIKFLKEYLYVDDNCCHAIYQYMKEQYLFSLIPSSNLITIEHYHDGKTKRAVFLTLFGRRVNDCLSRLIAYSISRSEHKDVEIGITDNGFVLGYKGNINFLKIIKLIKSEDIEKIMENTLDGSEILKRRFRHCAGRALMIIRNYKGKTKRVGRQQVSSDILLSTARRISKDFFIIKEAKREVMEDLMDIRSTKKVVGDIEKKKIKIKEIITRVPSPFSFNLVLQGYSEIIKKDDKIEFLKRMHSYVLADISLKKDKVQVKDVVSYENLWREEEENEIQQKITDEKLKDLITEQLEFVSKKVNLNYAILTDLQDLLTGRRMFSRDFILFINEITKEPFPKKWPKELILWLQKVKMELNS